MSRTASCHRRTGETEVMVSIGLDGSGSGEIKTGIGFFDHMLNLLAKHGLMDIAVDARGDLYVDGHHTVEDTGIVLGQALAGALGDKSGIRRYGSAYVPMDEALARVVVDISGRPFLYFKADFSSPRIGDYDTELTEEFCRALAVHAGLTLHVELLYGKNSHHSVEAIFKALGRALAEAIRKDERITGVMSSKGIL